VLSAALTAALALLLRLHPVWAFPMSLTLALVAAVLAYSLAS